MIREPDRLTLQVPAEPSYLAVLRAFAGRAARELGLDDTTVHDLKQATSEVAAGLIEGGAEFVELTIHISPDEISLRIPTPAPWRAETDFDRFDFIESLLPGAVKISEEDVLIRLAID